MPTGMIVPPISGPGIGAAVRDNQSTRGVGLAKDFDEWTGGGRA